MKVLITGGHFSPAYSLIKEIKARGDTIAIAGRRYTFENEASESLEYKIAKKEKIQFFEVKTSRFRRKLSPLSIVSALKVIRGFALSFKPISVFQPDIVLTFGGYVAFPVVYAAFFKGIPVILHEQTPKAGLSSKLISFAASKICISFETSRRYFPPKKTVFTGMPIRDNIYSVNKELPVKKGKPVIYITGGSAGAHFINAIVEQVIDKLLKDFTVIHQTGESEEFNDFERLSVRKEQLAEKHGEDYILRKFIYPDEIGFVLKKANLVVSRAGINSVLEFLALGKTCLLIPLSHGQTGEQLNNAKLLAETGIGEYLEERYITPNKFYEKIIEMNKNISEYEKNREAASHYIVTDAAKRILKVVDEIYGKIQK